MKTYTIDNGIISIEILNLGAKLLSFKHLKDDVNIVLRYKDMNHYDGDTGPYLNATIGPIAGRLEEGMFGDIKLSPLNATPNQLHSGDYGLHNQMFDVEITEDSVICTAVVDHRPGGFPSKIRYEIIYKLDGNSLVLSMKAWPETPQAINLTNHAYFNLDGSETFHNHYLEVHSNVVGKLDDTLINRGIELDVVGTVLDFNRKTKLRVCLEGDHAQFEFTKNLDHYYSNNKLIFSTDSKELTILTSAPGFQLYSASFFDETLLDEYNRPMKQFAGLAIEPQRPANEINYNQETPIFSNENPFTWTSRYTIDFK